MKHFLAIDQSTSATKVILYDHEGRPIDHESREHEQLYPRAGWVEHDLEEIWQNLLECVRVLLNRQSGKISTLACLSLTNQRETITVFERGTGKPLHNAIVWLCRRGATLCGELESAGYGNLVRERTGLRIDPYFSASKLKWLIREEPELSARLRSGEALIGTIDAYLLYRLTGGRVFATDHTNASRTLLYDIEGLRWHPELCELFDVPLGALPEVRESAARFGETTISGVLPHPIPICGIMGDSQASLFAQRCFQPGTAKVTLGTGSSVLLNIGEKPRLPEGALVTTIAWVWDGRPTYSFEGIINFSAASIAWLRDQLKLIQSAGESGDLAASIPDNGGVYLVPAFAGMGAPHWKPEAKAAIVGLTASADRRQIVRAAEESIAYQLYDVLEVMKRDAGIELNSIQADGGPTRDEFLMQFTADIVGIDVQAAAVSDCSALGAVMAGMLGLGHLESLEALTALPRETKLYSPRMQEEEVRKNLAGWSDAVERVL